MTFDLETRTGWPEEFRLFLQRHPRETWSGHPNLEGLARFWLSVHDGFRTFSADLVRSSGEFREGQVTPARFRTRFAPRLETFLSHLAGHHWIEDHDFFPVFGAAEPRLARGFDVLEGDHEIIHAAMDRMVETANAFLVAPVGDVDRMRFAGDDYVDGTERLIRLLARHLDDEEDLIVPLILERGVGGLGL